MPVIGFADESGTSGTSRCYAIGVVSLEAADVDGFSRYFKDLHLSHGVQGEAKWTKVKTSHGLTNFALDALSAILRSHNASFNVIVVNKAQYRNWRSPILGEEGAFYQTYTYLLRHLVRSARATTEVFIDDRSDEYAKRTEIVETVGNAMLAKLQVSGRLNHVSKVPSNQFIGIQVADLLTGAIWAAHERRLGSRIGMHRGKIETIKRLASLLGWDDLCYDTKPGRRFNIWHFPREYRSQPATRLVLPSPEIPYVSLEDLAGTG
jgi:hypothetical protein